MQHADPGWRGTRDHRYYIYFISGQNVLKDAIAFVNRRSFFYWSALCQKFTASGSVHSSSSASHLKDFDTDDGEDNYMEMDNGTDSSSISQPGRLVVTDSFSKE